MTLDHYAEACELESESNRGLAIQLQDFNGNIMENTVVGELKRLCEERPHLQDYTIVDSWRFPLTAEDQMLPVYEQPIVLRLI